MKKIILILAAFLLLFSCSVVEDMSDTAQVNIQLGDLDSGSSRFLAEERDNIIIAFLSESDVYLYEEYDVKTTISMNGIITGDYILLVLLREEDDDVVGLASKDVTIEAGVNYIDVTLGPGLWGLKLGPNSEELTEIDLSDLPDNYNMLVGDDNIAFDIPDDQFDEFGDFYFEFRTNAVDDPFDIIETNGVDLVEAVSYYIVDDYLQVQVYAYDGARSFLIEMADPVDGEIYEYTISFE